MTWAKVLETDPVGSHASWMENYPWTRLASVSTCQHESKTTDRSRQAYRRSPPDSTRQVLGDGNMGGYYQRDRTKTCWRFGESRSKRPWLMLEGGWD